MVYHCLSHALSSFIMSQKLHGTAIYADQLGWFWGVNGAAYMAVPWSVWVFLSIMRHNCVGLSPDRDHWPLEQYDSRACDSVVEKRLTGLYG